MTAVWIGLGIVVGVVLAVFIAARTLAAIAKVFWPW